MPLNKIIIILAHPLLEYSKINKHLIKAAESVKNIYIHDLYERYPDYWIDTKKEQELILNFNIIIFQHPIYWFSVPALLKQWIDLVLTYNWAYGPKGNKLQGKYLLSTLSLGGEQHVYTADGKHGHTLNEYMLPIKSMAKLCKMHYLPHFVIYGASKISEPMLIDITNLYVVMLNHLQHIALDMINFSHYPTMNEWALKQLESYLNE